MPVLQREVWEDEYLYQVRCDGCRLTAPERDDLLGAEREAWRAGWKHLGGGRWHCPACRRAEARRVAGPGCTPTLDEATRNPKEFVDGMTEE